MGRVGLGNPNYLRQMAWYFASIFLAMSAIALASGVTLGLFFAGVALCVVLAPWLIAREGAWDRRLLAAAAVTDAIALVWLIATMRDENLALWNWLRAYGVCLAVSLLQLGVLQVARWSGRATSAGVCILVTLTWLAAPFWLFPILSQAAVQQLINIHPLFAINAAVPLSVWSEAPTAYRLMDLNQDIFYSMPAGVSWCIAVHAAVGLALIWIKAMAGADRNTRN